MRVVACTHLPRTYSDHSPVQLMLEFRAPRVPAFTWRFPPYSLLDAVFKAELTRAIEEFFANNIGSFKTFATVWEAFKVYIKGVAMSSHAEVLRSIRNRLETLEKDISYIESSLLGDKGIQAAAELKQKLAEFQETANNEIKHMGKYATARSYGERDRPRATLAGILRPPRTTDKMLEMVHDGGHTLHTPEDIAEHF